MKLKNLNELIESLEVFMEIEFRYNGQHYYIGYVGEGTADTFIMETPDNEIGRTTSGNQLDILDTVIQGNKLNDVWEQLEMILY